MFSKNHLAKILHILVRYNYLSSLRGPNGGFELKRNPKSISLFEIYELMEGQLEKFQCAITCNKCYFEVCIFGNHPHRFSNEFRAYLKEKSLDDFTLKQSL